jgi:hypothetical protein
MKACVMTFNPEAEARDESAGSMRGLKTPASLRNTPRLGLNGVG